ncbi:MAG: fibronectin type III domain-containing protein [Candidatus Thermoplasmatota archaeon]|nr:fibronectin type III domain-containing protein [Candidatus Thermoplasmatota archaeon]
MKCGIFIWFVIFFLTFLPYPGSGDNNLDHPSKRNYSIVNDISDLENYEIEVFIENKGQWDPSILFVSETSYGKIALARDGIYHMIQSMEGIDLQNQVGSSETGIKDYCIVKVLFDDGSSDQINAIDPVETKYNFFIGNNRSRWASDVHGFQEVYYEDVWNGIDIRYYRVDGSMKYDMILHPGADPGLIKMRTEGCIDLTISEDSILLSTPIGVSISDSGLNTFYQDNGERIGSSFSLRDDGFGITLDAYDDDREVIIDPNLRALNFSTYIGGSGRDCLYQGDMDDFGNVVICGETRSLDFPVTTGSFNTTPTGKNAVVLKLDPDGGDLVFCTYLSGSSFTYCRSIKTDSKGDIIVAGFTDSIDFPVTDGAYQNNRSGGYDLFISKISSSGSSLLLSTYIGGSDSDKYPNIAIDDSDNIFVAAASQSFDFPITSDAFQSLLASSGISYDIVIFHIDISRMYLLYSTYLGGTSSQLPYAIKYYSDYLYVCGSTTSSNFHVTNGSFQTIFSGQEDGFVIKIDVRNFNFVYSTFFGGSFLTKIIDIDTDENGNVYACGFTDCANLPVTMGANDTTFNGGTDGFIMALDPSGKSLLFSTYEGGKASEMLVGLFRDNEGAIHVIGYGDDMKDFPTSKGAFQTKPAGESTDGIYMKIKKDGSGYHYSTLFGGSKTERPYDIFVDNVSNQPIMLGYTESLDFPTKEGSFQTSFNGGVHDGFVMRLDATLPPEEPLNITANPGNSLVELSWDPPISDGGNPIIEYNIYRSGISGSLNFLCKVLNNSYNDTSVQNGNDYYYAVRAVNKIGEGAFSVEVKARPGTISDPPNNFNIIKFGNVFVNLSWNAPFNNGGLEISGYILYRYNGTSSDPYIRSFDYNIKRFLDTDVTNGLLYRYRLTALNTMGESDPTPEINATPMTIPGEVKSFQVKGGPGYVLLTWEAPREDGGSAIIKYTITKNAGSPILIDIGPMILEYNDTDVVNGEEYTYTIRAKNLAGFGPPSSSVSVEPLDIPTPPRSVKVTIKPLSVIISWEPPESDGGSPIEEYCIYRREGECVIKETVDASFTSFTDVSLTNGITYIYRITAKNQVGESAPSIDVNATPLDSPGCPVGLSVAAWDGYVILTWKIPKMDGGTPILGYTIFRGELGSSMTLLSDVKPEVLTYNDKTVTNGKDYVYQVRAFNAFGNGTLTTSVSVRPAGLPSPPAQITVTSGDHTVDVEWHRSLNDGGLAIDTVRIYRWSYRTSMEMVHETENPEGNFWDTNVTNGVMYSYSLTAVNEQGEGPYSDTYNVTPLGRPTVVKDLSLRVISSGSIEITWTAPDSDGGSPILKYFIYRSMDGSSWLKIAEVPGDDIPIFIDENFEAGWNGYKLSAVNALGEGPLTDTRMVELKDKEARLSGMMIFILIFVIAITIMMIAVVVFILIRRANKIPEQPMLRSTSITDLYQMSTTQQQESAILDSEVSFLENVEQ